LIDIQAKINISFLVTVRGTLCIEDGDATQSQAVALNRDRALLTEI
jgi:hypothetical protein